MAITVVTLDTELRTAFNDVGEDAIPDDLAQRFINQNIISSEETLTLQKRTTGLFTYAGGAATYGQGGAASPPIAFRLGNRTTPFTEEGGSSYTVYEVGPSIQVTAGNPAATSITLTGCIVDWKECRAQVAEWLAVHRALQIAQSYGSANVTPETVASSLFYTAQKLRGPYGA